MAKRALEFAIELVVEPDEGGFHAYCPALKGLHVDGTTEEEALQNARIAAVAYLHSLIEHGDPIPVGLAVSATESDASGAHPDERHRHVESVRIPYAYA